MCLEGKNCAVPVSHRDFFVAKDEAPWPALRQVTPTNFIAGPLDTITNIAKNQVYSGQPGKLIHRFHHHFKEFTQF